MRRVMAVCVAAAGAAGVVAAQGTYVPQRVYDAARGAFADFEVMLADVATANVPRPLASEISKGGLGVLDGKTGETRQLFARELVCPTDDDYFRRFVEAMGDHPGEGTSTVAEKREATERFYFAQCVKDETMAESIADAYRAAAAAGPRPLAVHVNGAFHSDFGAGTAARTIRRLPGARVVVVTVVPVANLDALSPAESERARAHYLVYTIRLKAPGAPAGE